MTLTHLGIIVGVVALLLIVAVILEIDSDSRGD